MSLNSKCLSSLLNTPTVVSELSHRYFHVPFSEGLQLNLSQTQDVSGLALTQRERFT